MIQSEYDSIFDSLVQGFRIGITLFIDPGVIFYVHNQFNHRYLFILLLQKNYSQGTT